MQIILSTDLTTSWACAPWLLLADSRFAFHLIPSTSISMILTLYLVHGSSRSVCDLFSLGFLAKTRSVAIRVDWIHWVTHPLLELVSVKRRICPRNLSSLAPTCPSIETTPFVVKVAYDRARKSFGCHLWDQVRRQCTALCSLVLVVELYWRLLTSGCHLYADICCMALKVVCYFYI